MAAQSGGSARAWWRYALVVVGAVGVSVVLALLVRPHVDEGPFTTLDLQVFRVSGDAVRHGDNPYQFLLPQAPMSLVYPPFGGLLLAPFSLLTMEALRIVWFSGIFLALQGIVWLVSGWVGLRTTWVRLALCPLVAAVSIFLAPVYQELWSGQINVFLALLIVADLCRRDGARGRGLLVGIAAGIKLTPGLFIVYFLLTRRFKEAWTAIAGFAGTVALGFVVMPRPAWAYWTDHAWDTDRIYPDPSIPINQNLRGALARLLHDPDVLGLWLAIAVAVLVAGLAICVGLHRRGLEREGAVLVGVVSLLVSPVSWVYHWVWLVPVVIVLAAAAVRTRSAVWGTAAVVTAVVPLLVSYPNFGAGGAQAASGFWAALEADALVLVGVLVLVAGAVEVLRPRRTAVSPEPVAAAT